MALLELNRVTYETENQKIVKDVSFQVNEGEYLTIVGPSGGGKSTLLKLIASLITPTSGSILFQKKSQSEYSLPLYRQEVSYCFQQPTLFGETVADNMIFPFEVRQVAYDEKLAAEQLQRVDLTEDYLTKKIVDLSGGEKQRVALVRNLLFPPKLLLLDEVTAGLDDDSKKIVLNLIDDIHHHATTMIRVTHDDSEIASTQNILTIRNGEVVHESVSH
ncbi:ABC transporter ATP-binding protein [Vagococcus vulneris]|uniref:Spermidine/putrescine ABC transporter ATP-binding protein n=1 Tax=Vagococcus vulneris TaxID=1977869 RepID=A0A429ZY98_9ENTE|nr:ATP-binding cassette domain-containing protein [Vagococcus vulneris]RST98925.1 spermidine/putrescine ABC transporter ATP-binding protein [Vagococcus vulneris]